MRGRRADDVGVAAATRPPVVLGDRRRQVQLQFYVAGDGSRRRAVGGTRRSATAQGHELGALPAGRRARHSGKYFNNNWAGRSPTTTHGWVNAVYAQGGDNDGAFGGGVRTATTPTERLPAAAARRSGASAPRTVAGFPKDVTSAPDKARYDDAASWSGGKNCTGGFTAGAKRLQDWLKANYGAASIQGYNCRPEHGRPLQDEHPRVGRASDWFRNAGNAKQAGQVASFIKRMSAHGAAMARAMGVQYWIWNRSSTASRPAVSGALRRSKPHTDHVHIEQNLAGVEAPDVVLETRPLIHGESKCKKTKKK